MKPLPNILGWSRPLAAIVCRCGSSHVAAVSDELSTRARADALYRSASDAGYYRVDTEWLCADCYGSAVLDALMQARAGHHRRRREVDEAANQRAVFLAWRGER